MGVQVEKREGVRDEVVREYEVVVKVEQEKKLAVRVEVVEEK